MKRSFLLLFLLGFARLAVGQTWLSPVIGYDWMRVTTDANPGQFNYVQVLDSGFAVKSLVWGACVEQQIFKRISLEYQFGFLKKKVDYYQFGAFPVLGLRFEQYRNTLQIKYRFNQHFFGATGGYTHLNRNTRILLNGGYSAELDDFFIDKGIAFLAGGDVNNIQVSCWYYQGLSRYTMRPGLTFLPIRSIGASLSYRFKVLGRKKRR